MSQEPVKLVVFVLGGVVQDIMSCGVPCEVALVDADVEGNEANVEVPDLDGTMYKAEGSIWYLTNQPAEDTAHANKVFDAVAAQVREEA